LLKRFNLRAEQNVRTLSLGERVKASLLLALSRRPRLLILDEPTTGLDPVARHEMITEFMDVLRDDRRSILFSSHNTVDVERISDRITFIDRGRLVASCDKEDFLERWRRIEVQLPPDSTMPAVENIVAHTVDGQFHLLTTNHFCEQQLAALGTQVRHVHRMNLEEIFVANVMANREARGQ
jgi:ABC-2 type transport system ATP-binding protein